MNTGSKVVITNGVFTGIEGELIKVFEFEKVIYAGVKVNEFNTITVEYNDILKVVELDG